MQELRAVNLRLADALQVPVERRGGDPGRFRLAPCRRNHVDRVTDFAAGVDRIVLDRAVFATLSAGALDPAAFRQGTAAADADDRIIYDAASGSLFYDADGLGGAEAVRFAQLQTGLSLTGADFLVF